MIPMVSIIESILEFAIHEYGDACESQSLHFCDCWSNL
jgi:hypothetical protein